MQRCKAIHMSRQLHISTYIWVIYRQCGSDSSCNSCCIPIPYLAVWLLTSRVQRQTSVLTAWLSAIRWARITEVSAWFLRRSLSHYPICFCLSLSFPPTYGSAVTEVVIVPLHAEMTYGDVNTKFHTFLNSALDGMNGQLHVQVASHLKSSLCPLNKRLSGHQNRSG